MGSYKNDGYGSQWDGNVQWRHPLLSRNVFWTEALSSLRCHGCWPRTGRGRNGGRALEAGRWQFLKIGSPFLACSPKSPASLGSMLGPQSFGNSQISSKVRNRLCLAASPCIGVACGSMMQAILQTFFSASCSHTCGTTAWACSGYMCLAL